MKTNKIILYDEPKVPEIQLKRIKDFLQELFPIKVEIRKNILQYSKITISDEIAKTRIYNFKKPFKKQNLENEDSSTQSWDQDNQNIKEIKLYDGFEFQKVITNIIPETENILEVLHIVFTDYLVCTFDENDFRYHARALIGTNPTLISTTGIIEAPAKPKQYYLEQVTNSFFESFEDIKKKYKGEFLEYHDTRLSNIIEGYILQAIIYYETGNAFCTHSYCRLYNAHWQKDLLFTQIKNRKFCDKHAQILNQLKN